jgi:hypothetical protein
MAMVAGRLDVGPYHRITVTGRAPDRGIQQRPPHEPVAVAPRICCLSSPAAGEGRVILHWAGVQCLAHRSSVVLLHTLWLLLMLDTAASFGRSHALRSCMHRDAAISYIAGRGRSVARGAPHIAGVAGRGGANTRCSWHAVLGTAHRNIHAAVCGDDSRTS